jgi:hypothetical protein
MLGASPPSPPSAPSALPDGGHCPVCGMSLTRVHRDALDRWVSLFRSVHRYRCGQCHWEGLLGRDGPAPAPKAVTWRSRLLWMTLGAVCALGAVQGARWALRAQDQRPAAVAGPAVEAEQAPPGADFDGEMLPPTDVRVQQNRSPLALRRSCAWGVPGGNPYRGTVTQALQAAGLPAEVVRDIAERAEHGWTATQVEITRTGIRTLDHRREFGAQIPAMAFGSTLCFDTRVNFKPGHVEYATLYESADSQGRTYTVMVPFVCGNVSVLGQRGERPSRRVTEPAGWTLVLLGLLLMAGAGRWPRGRA